MFDPELVVSAIPPPAGNTLGTGVAEENAWPFLLFGGTTGAMDVVVVGSGGFVIWAAFEVTLEVCGVVNV